MRKKKSDKRICQAASCTSNYLQVFVEGVGGFCSDGHAALYLLQRMWQQLKDTPRSPGQFDALQMVDEAIMNIVEVTRK